MIKGFVLCSISLDIYEVLLEFYQQHYRSLRDADYKPFTFLYVLKTSRSWHGIKNYAAVQVFLPGFERTLPAPDLIAAQLYFERVGLGVK
jgi:hypothetical protein